MNHLLRSLTPISDSNWELLDEEARQRMLPALAARRLTDFSGPHGWSYSASFSFHVATPEAAVALKA